MPNGIDRRAQIDTETVKALLLINGGGAVALLTLLRSLLEEIDYQSFTRATLVGVLIFMIGLVSAVIHNRLRRICSLRYDQHQMRPPHGQIFGITLWGPTVCCFSTIFMWLSIIAFFVAGSYVAAIGICTFS